MAVVYERVCVCVCMCMSVCANCPLIKGQYGCASGRSSRKTLGGKHCYGCDLPVEPSGGRSKLSWSRQSFYNLSTELTAVICKLRAVLHSLTLCVSLLPTRFDQLDSTNKILLLVNIN